MKLILYTRKVLVISLIVIGISVFLPKATSIDQSDILFFGGFGLIGICVIYNFFLGSPTKSNRYASYTALSRKELGLGVDDFNANHMDNQSQEKLRSHSDLFLQIGIAGLVAILYGMFFV